MDQSESTIPSYSKETLEEAITLLDSILAVQAKNGSVFGKILPTYHFIDVLAFVENPQYYDQIERAKQWIIKHRTMQLNPYWLLAFLEGDVNIPKAFWRDLDNMMKHHRLDNGAFLFSRRFIAEGESFSTLIALKVLLSLPDRSPFEAYCRSAFRFCYNNLTSFKSVDQLGFLVWLYTRSGFQDFSDVNKQVLSRVLESQKDGLWEGGVLQTAYVVIDVMPYYQVNSEVRKRVTDAVNTLRRMGVSIKRTGYFEAVRYVAMLIAYYGEAFRQAIRSRTIPSKF